MNKLEQWQAALDATTGGDWVLELHSMIEGPFGEPVADFVPFVPNGEWTVSAHNVTVPTLLAVARAAVRLFWAEPRVYTDDLVGQCVYCGMKSEMGQPEHRDNCLWANGRAAVAPLLEEDGA